MSAEPTTQLPSEYQDHFTAYGPVTYACGSIPSAYGFKPKGRIGEVMFKQTGRHGHWKCVSAGNWVLITRYVTKEELIAQVGKPTAVVVGPRGGWKFAIYGSRIVRDRFYDPREEHEVEQVLESEYKENRKRF